MSSNKLLTVFTPTYNRAHTLTRLYNSLCRQSCKDFEWLVIDDGSTDSTTELIASFISENKIPVRYIKKENGGLHTGYNTAYANISTELNVCIDSDDFMPEDAVEIIRNTWSKRSSDNYAGITGLDYYTDSNKPIGGFFPENLKEAYLLDLYIKGIHRGDSKQVMRTDIMKDLPPMIGYSEEKNFNPIYLILQACDNLPVILINHNLCYVEYQPYDSMSRSIWRQYFNSPKSFAKLRALEMGLKRSNFLNNLRLSVHYDAVCFLSKEKSWLLNTPKPFLALMMAPAGWILSLIIKIKAKY
ncbi:MAG: glycosyltransferase family 2 protein [Muribaculaceae bacterium]|nr:glycosyltransferase family 2 protein [Muribaculaceae bacterium]